MYYIIGDIHGYFKRLVSVFDQVSARIKPADTLIFLGDYIDRGPHSYEVVDFLIELSRTQTLNTVFLKGNHEDMFMAYLRGEDTVGAYIINGGDATIRSYIAHRGVFELPRHHREFIGALRLYYEGEDFIAVHAGLNPMADSLEAQDEHDLLWIREQFFSCNKRWEKTIIFGHTPVAYLSREGPIYHDARRNIIGIDSGVIMGNQLTCLVWPTRELIRG
ncbi:MAG TPA: metallophosphoesterase family protein [Spirochaetota bacterium]|nr:metallophosphoesterase family protein [Spirochaetota bacterium]